MIHVDLFSGIGGFALAMDGLAQTVLFCENEPAAQEVLAHHWPNVPICDDIRSLTGADIGDVMAGRLKKLTEAQAAEAVELYDAGQSLAQLGLRYGVTRTSMHDLLKRRTTMRPQKRYGKDNHFYRGGVKSDKGAQRAVESAIASGDLVPPDHCERCGGTKEYSDGRRGIHAHHHDYNKPLEVVWLCQPCHHEEHKREAPVILTAGFP